jgi:FkbM family methyltransferase
MFFYLNYVRNKRLAPALNAQANPQQMKGGFFLHTHDTGDFLSEWCRLYREYEPETGKVILSYLKTDSIFLDIGANLGIFTIGIAAARPDVHVCGIEPSPKIYKLLQKSIISNNLSERVTCFQVAAGSSDETLEFEINQSNSGDSSIVTKAHPSRSETIQVAVKKLDGYQELVDKISKLNRTVSCVKMDIQGAELMAIMGLREIIQKHKPVLIIEVDEECLARFDHSPIDLFTELAQLNYFETGRVELNVIFQQKVT